MITQHAIRRRLRYYHRQILGRIGEWLALFYYWRSWHYIVARNWRCSIGEIDLITIQNRTLHIVEVKTHVLRFGPFSALSQMTESKRQKLKDLSTRYWNSNAVEMRRMRVLKMQIDYFGIDVSWKGLVPKLLITKIPRLVATNTGRNAHFEEPRERFGDSVVMIR